VAFKRYRGGTSAVGKAFYKGGFEQKMTRKEAALILETTFVAPRTWISFGSIQKD
jgi:DnaJ family protein C protein 19